MQEPTDPRLLAGVDSEYITPDEPKPSTEARNCAREIFQPVVDARAMPTTIWGIKALPLDDARFDDLPFELYEAQLTLDDVDHFATFTLTGGECRLINGDLDLISGMEISDDHQASYASVAFNAAVGQSDFDLELATDEAKIEYAYSAYSLLAPVDLGGTHPELELLATMQEFDRIAGDPPADCEVSGRRRMKAIRETAEVFREPEVTEGAGVQAVKFFTWSEEGGVIRAHTVYLSPDGTVSLHSERVGSHIGDHVD